MSNAASFVALCCCCHVVGGFVATARVGSGSVNNKMSAGREYKNGVAMSGEVSSIMFWSCCLLRHRLPAFGRRLAHVHVNVRVVLYFAYYCCAVGALVLMSHKKRSGAAAAPVLIMTRHRPTLCSGFSSNGYGSRVEGGGVEIFRLGRV